MKDKLNSQVPEWVQPGKLRWVWALWGHAWRTAARVARRADRYLECGGIREYYERMHSEENRLPTGRAGDQYGDHLLFKGFGIESGVEEMEKTAAFVELCHRYGIRVLGYLQLTTIVYETLLKEVPDLEKWAMVDADGNKITYGGAYWRWLACATCDEHMTYLECVIYKALVEAKLDGMHWDGGTYDCHCERCQQRFREYLRDKYGQASGRDRRAFRNRLPRFRPYPPASNPRDPFAGNWSPSETQ